MTVVAKASRNLTDRPYWKLVQLGCRLVRQFHASYFGSEVSQELTAEVEGCQLEVNPARELAAEASGQSMRLARWSPPSKDVSLEAEERPLLEAVTKQRDWWH
jgi:hypothetical protein